MQQFSRTLSAILRGRWMINPQFAESQLPMIAALLNGTGVLSSTVPRTGGGEFEMPFFIDPSNMHRFNWSDMLKWDSEQRAYIPNPNIPQGIVALVPINGPILKYDGECGEPGSISRSTWLLAIDNMPQVSGVVFLIDSPGGMVDGTQTLAATIKSMAKYTVAFIDDGMACSAAMWIASACNEIYASKKNDTVGSIGVYCSLFDFRGYMEKMGVKKLDIYAPQSTEKNIEYRNALDGDTSLIEADLGTLAQDFITTIKANRPGAAKSEAKWSTGATFYASEAKSLGLIDGILPLQTVIKRAAQQKKSSISMSNKIATTETVVSLTPVLTAAGADAFPVIAAGDAAPDAGLLLTEAQVTAISQALEASGAQLAQANTLLSASNDEVGRLTTSITALEKADTVATLEAQVATLTAERDEATASNTQSLSTIETLTAENAALKAQIEEGGQPSGTGTTVAGNPDTETGAPKADGKPSWYKPDFN